MSEIELYLNLLKNQRDQLELQVVQASAKVQQLEAQVQALSEELQKLTPPAPEAEAAPAAEKKG
jgi:vacuolar-type H+-ATPase subunit D/Vma8